jgi:hypothetical protein
MPNDFLINTSIVISILLFFVAIGTIIDLYVTVYKRFSKNQNNTEEIKKSAEENAIKIHKFEIENEKSKNKSTERNNHKSDPNMLPIERNKIYKILVSFSAYTNTAKLFHISKSSGQLDCLNGIRVLSITWVVLGHHVLLTPSIAGI